MSMVDCPCCLPPWSYRYKSEPAVYFGSSDAPGTSEIARFGTVTGVNPTTMQPTSIGVRAIACDQRGNVYFSDDTTVKAMDVNGNLLWSGDHGGFLRGMAVTNDGKVYSCDADEGKIKQWDAMTGDEGWSYTWEGERLGGICVDKLGNVYAVGDPDPAGRQLVSLDAAGSERWRNMAATLSGPLGDPRAVAINAANTELAVAMGLLVSGQPTAFIRNASNGNGIVSYSRAASCWSCAYDKDGNSYFSGARNAAGYLVLFNGSPGFNITSASHAYGIAAGPDGVVYLALSNNAGNNVALSAGVSFWNRPMPGGPAGAYCVEYAGGRCGAFDW